MSDRIKDCIMMTDARQDLKYPATNAGNTMLGSSLKNGKRKFSAAHKLDITDVTCKFPKLTVSTVPPKGNVTWGKTTEQNDDNGIDIVSKGSDDSTQNSEKTMGNQTTVTELSAISTMVSNVLDMLVSMKKEEEQ